MNRVAREIFGVAKEIEAVMGRFHMDRSFYMPKAENLVTVDPQGTDLEIYTYSTQTAGGEVLYAVAFAGKQAKPIWHFRFRNEGDRQRRIDSTIADRKSRMQMMDTRRQERQNFRHGLQKDDILASSWGYDQTNVDFYQVVEVLDKAVRIRPIEQKVVSSSPGSDSVVPVPNHFSGAIMLKKVSPGDSVKIESYAYASKWSGRPLHQTAAGFGH